MHSLISADTNPGEHCTQCYRCGTTWDYPDSLDTGAMVPYFIAYYPCTAGDACQTADHVGAHHFAATGPESATCHYCGETYGGEA